MESMRIKKWCGAALAGVFLIVFAARIGSGAADFEFSEKDILLRGIAVSLPEEAGSRIRVKVKAEQNVFLTAPSFPKISYGDLIAAECRFYGAKNFWEYGRLRARGAEGNCFSRLGVSVIARKNGDPFLAALSVLRAKMLGRIRSAFPEPQAGLLAGLLVGERASMSPELESALIRTGTMHIVAISGFNVAMITSGLFGMTAWILGRRRAFWIVIALVFTFTLLVGASASVVRAGVMGAAALVGRVLGRPNAGTRLLTFAAGTMLAINPWLIFDYGFLLSFAATLGLSAFSGPMAKRLEFIPEELFMRRILAETIAAAGATLPLSILFFGNVSFIAPLTNVMVLSLVPAITWLGFAAVIWMQFPLLGQALAWLVWFLLTSALGWIEYTGSWEFAGAHFSAMPARIGASIILSAILLRHAIKKIKRR